MLHMCVCVYVCVCKVLHLSPVPAFFTSTLRPRRFVPSGTAGARTSCGHQVAPPRLAAPGTFRAPKVGGAEAVRCVSGTAGGGAGGI